MTAFLPKNDPRPDRRQRSLASRQLEYRYNYDYVSPLAVLDAVPRRDGFAFSWMWQMGERVLTALENRTAVALSANHQQALREKHSWFTEMVELGTLDLKSFLEALTGSVELTLANTPVQSLDEYATLFHSIQLPPVSLDASKDEVFAEMRLAGPNPLILTHVDGPGDDFPVTEQDYRDALPGDTLEAAGKEGRLFLVDYSILAGIESGEFAGGKKYLFAPRALFALHPVTRQLTPVAIQCDRKPGPDNPIFTPVDGWAWKMAKTIVEMADGNYHEAVSHFARTHMLAEPFALATHRQLDETHPLALLLLPHFEGTFAINNAAHRHLMAPHGVVDRLLGGKIEESRSVAAKGLFDFPLAQALLPSALKLRGVDDPAVLPHYPYRDDALLLWGAIRDWAGDYLRCYYTADQDVRDDTELAGWLRELGARDGGRLCGVDALKAGDGIEPLTDLVTLVLFTCSVQHAAVNFPQYDLMSYAPSMPLACYAPAPAKKAGVTETDYLAMLPPIPQAELQLSVGYFLGTLRYTSLGQYERGHFTDRRVLDALARFQRRLAETEQTIRVRNQMRRPYTFLLPSAVPQSINV